MGIRQLGSERELHLLRRRRDLVWETEIWGGFNGL